MVVWQQQIANNDLSLDYIALLESIETESVFVAKPNQSIALNEMLIV